MNKKPAKDSEIVQQAAVGQGEFLLYQTEDARTRIQLRLQDGELAADRTIRKFRIVAREASREMET